MSHHGWVVVDKPRGITSRDAVDRVQLWFPRGTAVGHTGTLDPLADGVLVLAVGCATRLAEYVQAGRKTYVSDFCLGATSATDDGEGPISALDVTRISTLLEIEAVLPRFVGEISQTPPSYSAVKVKGKRAYAEARAGRDVAPAPRTVFVESIKVVEFAYPRLRVEVKCGKGTYIRSLARDLGGLLGCGAYVETLTRTRVADFTRVEASPLDGSKVRLLPLERGVASLPRLTLPAEDIHCLCNGAFIRMSVDLAGDVAVFDQAGELVAIAMKSNGFLRPTKVLRR